MMGFLLRRLGVLVPTLLGVSLVAFGLIRLVPGDPVLLMLGERGASPPVYAEMRAKLALDRPLPEQYLSFVAGALHGNLGRSTVSKQPVTGEFAARFPATLELGTVAMALAILIGIPLGILAALRRNSWLDYTVMSGSLVGYSMPIFWWGLLLILLFSVKLGWTPVSGRIGVEYDVTTVTGFLLIDSWISSDSGTKWAAFASAVSHLLLPAIVLATVPLATIARMTRSSMLEVLGEDYVRTARAKGLGRTRIVWVHALRNALVPIVTVIGLLFGSIVTGAILTETIFSWPGIGGWLVKSVVARDYPVIQGGILIIASIIVLINMAVDVVYAIVNPRIRDAGDS
jgi:dipeptide transport system permease protein